MKYAMTIPSVPPSLNKTLRMHWTKRRALKDEWLMWVSAHKPGYVFHPTCKMRCRVTLHHSRFYDKDNAYGACKPVLDALIHYRLIVDDSREFLDLTVEQAKAPRKKPLTVIELEAA